MEERTKAINNKKVDTEIMPALMAITMEAHMATMKARMERMKARTERRTAMNARRRITMSARSLDSIAVTPLLGVRRLADSVAKLLPAQPIPIRMTSLPPSSHSILQIHRAEVMELKAMESTTIIPMSMTTRNRMTTNEEANMEIKAVMKINKAMATKETTIKAEATTTEEANLTVSNPTRHLNTEMVHIDQSATPATLKLRLRLMVQLLQLKAMTNINSQLVNIKHLSINTKPQQPINTPRLPISTPQLQMPTAQSQTKATSTRTVAMPSINASVAHQNTATIDLLEYKLLFKPHSIQLLM